MAQGCATTLRAHQHQSRQSHSQHRVRARFWNDGHGRSVKRGDKAVVGEAVRAEKCRTVRGSADHHAIGIASLNHVKKCGTDIEAVGYKLDFELQVAGRRIVRIRKSEKCDDARHSGIRGIRHG